MVLFDILRYVTKVYNMLLSYWFAFWWKPEPTNRYFLVGDGDLTDPFVPEGSIYIEEWTSPLGQHKWIVKYGGDPIPVVPVSPDFNKKAKQPWIWIGDKDAEVTLTRVFDRFLVPGNVIKPSLVEALGGHPDISYIEPGTFDVLKIPDEGLTIHELI